MGVTTQEVIADGQKYVMNTYGRLPMVIDRGEGCYVWDLDGNRYLDLVAGIAVNSLGHSHPAVAKAIQEQSEKLLHCSNLYWIENQVKLAKLLVEKSGMGKAFFCNSGAEANEAAIKLARKWGKGEKYHIITMKNSFHGRTMGALTATAQEKYQKAFMPLLEGFSSVPLGDLEALEAAIRPETCAIMMEPIQGESGINVPTQEYVNGVQALCKKHNILLILDEVQTGIGRTGKPKSENIKLIVERNNLQNPVYVGDTQWDCDAATAAGVPFIFAAYGFGKVTDKPEIHDMAELPALV